MHVRLIHELFKSRLVGNALSLYAIQGLNTLLPLLVLPYLLRILGATDYGALAMAQTVMGYGMVVTDFGFTLTAARDISVARHDAVALARIYWTTMAAKALLLGGCLLVIAGVVAATPSFRMRWPVYLATSLMVIGNVAFPQWYLQGLERLRDSALLQACARIVSVGAILAFVRTPEDLWIAAVISSISQLISLLAALALRKRLLPSEFYRPSLADIRAALHGSWHVFASSISTTLYGNTTTLVLGLMWGERAVALYSMSLRVVTALQQVAMPLTQAVFPRASILFANDPQAAWSLINRIIRFLLVTVGLCALLLAIFAPAIVRLIGGPAFAAAVPLVRIMSIVPVAIGVWALPAQIVLVCTGKTKELHQIYLRTGLANIAVMPLLIHFFHGIGAAVALTIAEIFATAQMVHLAARGSNHLARMGRAEAPRGARASES